MRRVCWKNAGGGCGEPSLACSPCTPTTMRPGATNRGPPCGLIWTKPPPPHFAFQTPRLCPCFRPTPRHSPPVPPLRPSPRVLSAAVAVDRSLCSQQCLPGLPDAAGLSARTRPAAADRARRRRCCTLAQGRWRCRCASVAALRQPGQHGGLQLAGRPGAEFCRRIAASPQCRSAAVPLCRCAAAAAAAAAAA